PPPPPPPAETTSPENVPPRPYPVFSIALDYHLFNHKLEFVNVTNNNLRSFSAKIQAAPTLRTEFYPLAFTDLGLFSGIGLDFSFGFGLGLKTKDENENAFPMKWMVVDGGLRWRLQFSKTWKAAVTPMLGIQHLSFSHGTLENGTELSGFPNLKLTALRIGVGFELPFASDWVLIFGDFSILPTLSAKDILSDAYFPEGSAFGFETKLGIGIKVIGPLYVRLSGFFSRTNFSLNPSSSNPFQADSAFHQRVGAQLGLCVSF
ncbi:MAG: hypothetical protein FWB81_03280, partial [Cystobacterineae bacterium]|nr:hypothetical protein [Cystobacterineae bacterium]